MSNDKPRTHHTETPSILDTFPLSFEYDVSWAEVRKAVKKRAT
jgi:hypothetical protein